MQHTLIVTGMQINENAVLTVNTLGGDLVTSGVFAVEHKCEHHRYGTDKHRRTCAFQVGGQRFTVLVRETNSDPAVVGQGGPGDKRFTWKGRVITIADVPGWTPPSPPRCSLCEEFNPLHPQTVGQALHLMGHGFWVRVPHDTAIPAALRSPDMGGNMIPIPAAIVPALIARLGLISKDGDPPRAERVPSQGYKMGWAEMGLDGDVADWYAMVQ